MSETTEREAATGQQVPHERVVIRAAVVPRFTAIELDTGYEIEGHYYLENGYWMDCGKPDYSRPVQRHYIVDSDGRHRETCPSTLKALSV